MLKQTSTEFLFKPQYELGIASNLVNVYSAKNHKLIGCIEACNVPKFQRGEYGKFMPVCDWKKSYSQGLKDKFGLSCL